MAGTTRSPDSTVRILDLSDAGAAQLAELLAAALLAAMPLSVGIESSGTGAEVRERTDAVRALQVEDAYTSFQAVHQTLTPSTDTPVDFDQEVALVTVRNWSTSQRLLVKDGVIDADNAADADYVSVAPTAGVSSQRTFVMRTMSIHLRSAGAVEATVVGSY